MIQGSSEAIQAAGGVSELARRIGISQPSVSNWDKVPAERVLAVEAATGVARSVLRPDLYRRAATAEPSTRSMSRARRNTRCSPRCWRARPTRRCSSSCRALRGDATPLGVAHVALAEAAAQTSVERVEREYFDLFIGLGRGELLPYGSYYLTGFLHERPLARLRDDLARFGIERVEGNYEPEDHAAILCEIMAGARGRQSAGAGRRRPRIFEKHLAPWIGRFFADLERAEAANFYRQRRHARPRVHRNRDGSLRAAVVRRRQRNNEPEGMR